MDQICKGIIWYFTNNTFYLELVIIIVNLLFLIHLDLYTYSLSSINFFTHHTILILVINGIECRNNFFSNGSYTKKFVLIRLTLCLSLWYFEIISWDGNNIGVKEYKMYFNNH